MWAKVYDTLSLPEASCLTVGSHSSFDFLVLDLPAKEGRSRRGIIYSFGKGRELAAILLLRYFLDPHKFS